MENPKVKTKVRDPPNLIPGIDIRCFAKKTEYFRPKKVRQMQMQQMWLWFFWGRWTKKTFARKVKQMQPIWLYILSCRRFKETFDNAQWRKAKQMQPMWLCILSQYDYISSSAGQNWPLLWIETQKYYGYSFILCSLSARIDLCCALKLWKMMLWVQGSILY